MTAKTANALLVALNRGLSPYAAPLECVDLTGLYSLFGENMKAPRPLCRWEDEIPPDNSGGAECSVHPHTVVLWKGESASGMNPPAEPGAEGGSRNAALPEAGHCPFVSVASPGVAAEPCRYAGQRTGGPSMELSVAATTYIAGNCTSTFDVAWQLVRDNVLPEWGAVLASRQSAGRGQLRREWHSPRGNLYVTFRLPDDPNLRGDAASVVAGWLLAAAFSRLGFPVSLKWPNDLLNDAGQKVGGILLEERGGVLLAGVGVNIAKAPPPEQLRADHAASAAVLSGREESSNAPPAPFPLWRSLVRALIQEYICSVAGQSAAGIFAGVNAMLAWKGRAVTLFEGDGSAVSGRLEGVGRQGGVLLRCAGGETRELSSGSLSLGTNIVL